MGSGGGGSSGEVKYPDYIEAKHVYALADSWDDVKSAQSNNPYAGKTAYDPSSMYAKIQETVDDFDELSLSAGGCTTIQNIMTNIKAELYRDYDGLFAADDWTWYWNLVEDYILPDFITTLGWTLDTLNSEYTVSTVVPVYELSLDFPTEYYENNSLGRPYTPSVSLADPALVAIDTSYIQDEVDASADIIDDQIESDVLPRFEAGMRDLNSVLSSEFVIGKAIIEGMRDRDVMKLQADLRVRAYELYEGSKQHYQTLRMQKNQDLLNYEQIKFSAHDQNEKNVLGFQQVEAEHVRTYANDQMEKAKLSLAIDELKSGVLDKHDNITKDLMLADAQFKIEQNKNKLAALQQKIASTGLLMERKHNDIIRGYELVQRQIMMNIQWQTSLGQLGVDAARISIVAGKEQVDRNLEIAVGSSGWALSAWQAWANVCAAPAGGTAIYSSDKKSSAASAIGGALSGAASGAMLGSAIPGVGTAIGAGVGAVAGLLSGLF